MKNVMTSQITKGGIVYIKVDDAFDLPGVRDLERQIARLKAKMYEKAKKDLCLTTVSS